MTKISVAKSDLPNANFASDNAFAIPALLPSLQADYIDQPLKAWGGAPSSKHWRACRDGKKSGTWHFYVSDHIFTALLKHPEAPLKTAAPTLCEPNFSMDVSMPLWRAIHTIGWKRWLARYWQSAGRRILVDLNVPGHYEELNLTGVPTGWKAYATRASDWDLAGLIRRHELAVRHAGTNELTFLCYGGGSRVQEYCRAHGLEWAINEVAEAHQARTSKNAEGERA